MIPGLVKDVKKDELLKKIDEKIDTRKYTLASVFLLCKVLEHHITSEGKNPIFYFQSQSHGGGVLMLPRLWL